jgi:hypothetical protein
LEHGRNRDDVNLDLFEYPFPSRLGIDDELTPNAVLDLRFMPVFGIEDFLITLNPNGSQCNASTEVQILIFFFPRTS